MPVRHYSSWHRLPLPCLATWRHVYCLLGTPLVAPGRVTESIPAILDGMQAGSRRTAFASLEWTSSEGQIADAVRNASPRGSITFDRFARAVLYQHPQNDYLQGRFKGKHRREQKRLAKILAEELGGPLELVDRSNEQGAVEAFLAMEASGWKGKQGTALAANPLHAEFFREIVGAFAARGDVALLFLQANGRAVAARCDLLMGGASFCFKVAYDEHFQRFSPGRELEIRLIDRFHEDSRVEWMDSCSDPANNLIGRMWVERRELLTTVHPTPGPLGALAKAAIRMAIAVRERRRSQNSH